MDHNEAMKIVLSVIGPITWTEFTRQHWALSAPLHIPSPGPDPTSRYGHQIYAKLS